MIITYLRSSSLGTLEWCPQKYLLTYVLGFKDKSNVKAVMGSIMHKCLETLGSVNLARKAGKKKLKDDVFNNKLSDFDDLDMITRKCFEFYQQHEPSITLGETEFKTCKKWFLKALAYNGGMMDPRKQDIFAVEQFFEFEIPHEWAKYSYQVGDRLIEGRLGLKGVVDVILNEGENYYQIQDYKSGRRLDWATGKTKNQESFQKDPQLLFYYYALRNVYPDAQFFVSIYYVNHGGEKYPDDGGVFTVVFDDNDYAIAESMIKQKFEYIKSIEIPNLLDPTNRHWKCKSLCEFAKPSSSPGLSVCQFIHEEVKSKGLEQTMIEHGDLSKIDTYRDGGGKLEVLR